MPANSYYGPAGWDCNMPTPISNMTTPVEINEDSAVEYSLEAGEIDFFSLLQPIVYDNSSNGNEPRTGAGDKVQDRPKLYIQQDKNHHNDEYEVPIVPEGLFSNPQGNGQASLRYPSPPTPANTLGPGQIKAPYYSRATLGSQDRVDGSALSGTPARHFHIHDDMSWRPQVTPQINYEGPAQYRQQVIPPQYVQQPVPHGYAPHTMIPFHDRGRQPFENVGSQPLHHGQDMEQLNHSSNAQGSPPGESQAEVYGSPAPIPSGYVPRILTEAAYEAKIAERHKHDPNSDYPKEPAAQQQIIKDLFEAFKNTDGIIDKPQVGLAFKDGSIPDEEIELVCWELVLAARDSQVHALVAEYHGCKYLGFGSFYERIAQTIDACKVSKAMCKMMLAPNFLHRVVDNPGAELQRKKCNQKLNDKKTGQNKAGQIAIKEKYAREDGVWLKEHGSASAADESEPAEQAEQVAAERPRKRARPNPRSDSSSNQS